MLGVISAAKVAGAMTKFREPNRNPATRSEAPATCPACGSELGDPLPRFLTKKELAAILRKSPRWVEVQVRENSMPSLMFEGTPRFELEVVLNWLAERAKRRRSR